MSKRILSLVLAFVMVLGTFGTVFAATGNAKVDWLVDQGLVKGDQNGNLNLEANIDRASVAKLVVEALNQTAAAAGMQAYQGPFSDVPVTNWSNGNINVAYGLNLMVGNNGKFMPSATISNAEVLTILVRMMDGEPANAVWPATHIAKAQELGILEGTEITNFMAPAVREDIFEMFYNVLVGKQVGNYQIVKGIVLENYRVASLDKDEIVVEILKELQRPNYAEESRDIEGDQISFKVNAKIADVEDLLGKVADFTIDKNGNVVAVKIDSSYKYEVGALKTSKDSITIAKKEYNVKLDERFDKDDERIFRTYINNKSFKYSAVGTTTDLVTKAEFARVTVKNGKVLFIDGFNFDDVAPVKEVRKDGEVVYVYDDNNDALEKKLSFNSKTKVVSIKDKVMNVASLTDIEELDVVHYNVNANTVFVREDAKVEGTYEKYSTGKIDDNIIINIFVDGEEYVARFDNSKKPVHSMTGADFTTLERSQVSEKLQPMKKLDVTLLLDMNNRVQYISAATKDSSFTALIDNVLSSKVKFQKADGEAVVLEATMDTTIELEDTTTKSLKSLNAADLVKVWANEDGEITKIVRLVSADKQTAEAYTAVNSTYITVNGEKVYLDRNAKLFLDLQVSPYTRKGITAAEFTKAYTQLNGTVFVNLNDAGNATEVIFKTVEAKGSLLLPAQTVRVLDIYGFGTRDLYEIEFEKTDGEILTRKVAKAKLAGIEAGDIISIVLQNTEAQNVETITRLIKADAEVYKVVRIDAANKITLADANGDVKTFPMLRAAATFGYVTRDEFISYSLNADGIINAIEVRDDEDYTVGTWEVEVDTTALETVLETVATLEEAEYTAESWEALQAALELPETTQAEIDAKVLAIEEAIAALEEVVEEVKVTAVVTAGKTVLGVTEYTIVLENADLADITEIMVNGNSVFNTLEVETGIFLVGELATDVVITVDGAEVIATIK